MESDPFANFFNSLKDKNVAVDTENNTMDMDIKVEPDCDQDQDPFANVFKQLKEVVNKNASETIKLENAESIEKCTEGNFLVNSTGTTHIQDTSSGIVSVTNADASKDQQTKANTSAKDLTIPSYEQICSDSNKTATINGSVRTVQENQPTGEKNIDFTQVKIKQEPLNLDYEKAAQLYRQVRPIVVYDSTSDESSSSSEDEMPPKKIKDKTSDIHSSDNDKGDGEVSDDENKVKHLKNKNIHEIMKERTRTAGEVFPEELPPLEDLVIDQAEELNLAVLGEVSGIVGLLVIVKANEDTPALYDDTVFFSDTKKPLGLVFEVFGTVEKTFYSMRFNSIEDIKNKGIKIGDTILFAPTADNITKYVFIKELEKMKFDDASWENDNEPPPQHRDFSDDEEEKKNKQARKAKKFKDRSTVEESAIKQSRTSFPYKDHDKSQSLNGDSNKNTFAFGNSFSSPKPQDGLQRNNMVHQNRSRPKHQTGSRFIRPQHQAGPRFSQKPNWEHQRMGLPCSPHGTLLGPPGSESDGPQLLKGDLNRNPFYDSNPSQIRPPRNFMQQSQERPPHFSPSGPRYGQQPHWDHHQANMFQGPPQFQGPPGLNSSSTNPWNRFPIPPQHENPFVTTNFVRPPPNYQDMGQPRNRLPPNQH